MQIMGLFRKEGITTTVVVRPFLLLLIFCAVASPFANKPNQLHAQDTDRLTVTGQLEQGSKDGTELPAGLGVELVISDVTSEIVERFESQSDANGNFVFENIPRYGEDFLYTVVTTYAGVQQISRPIGVEALGEPIILTVFDTSPVVNASQIRIIEGNIVISFTDVTQVGLQVLLDFTVLNISDHIVTGEEYSLAIELPVGAYGIGASDFEMAPGRYRIDVDGVIPIVKDTLPIVPDRPNTIRLSYFLPYDSGAVIHQVFPVDVVNFTVLVPKDTVQVSSDVFTQKGKDIEGTAGVTYRPYVQTEAVEVDENGKANLIFTLEGIPTQSTRQVVATKADEDRAGFSWLVPALLAVVIFVGAVVFILGRKFVAPVKNKSHQ